jgi:hypothetical protein
MKRYLRCRWAIDEETVRRLERLKRHRGIPMHYLVNAILNDALGDRRDMYRRGDTRSH